MTPRTYVFRRDNARNTLVTYATSILATIASSAIVEIDRNDEKMRASWRNDRFIPVFDVNIFKAATSIDRSLAIVRSSRHAIVLYFTARSSCRLFVPDPAACFLNAYA